MYRIMLKRWPEVDIEQKWSKRSSMLMSEHWLSQPNSSNSKASDRVQSKRPIETPGFLISHILKARLAFCGYLFTISIIRDFFPGQN